MFEGSSEVKLPTIWADGKAQVGRVKRRSKKRKSQKKEDPGARKGRKVATHCVFPMICGSGGSKSRLAKAAGAEPCGQMRDQKLHGVVARSTFLSQNAQNTPTSDHFWKLRWWKSAHRCGAKHMSKSKCTKHLSFGPLLKVAMSKKYMPFWREAHLQVKKLKALHVRSTFGSCDVEKVHAVVARSTFRSQNLGALEMFKKCTQLWREAQFEVRMYKAPHVCATFGRWRVVLCGRRKGFSTCQKWAKREGFGIFKNDGRRETFQEDLQRWISRGRRSTRDMFIRDVRRSGERGCILEHQIFRFADDFA